MFSMMGGVRLRTAGATPELPLLTPESVVRIPTGGGPARLVKDMQIYRDGRLRAEGILREEN
jgi:hypothetical protein